MNQASERLVTELVDAYSHHVRRLIEGRGWTTPDGLDQALADGERWLAASLADELGRPFGGQRRGPLEIFQEAMRFPTEVLAAEGVPVPPRDEVAASALPGDAYDLAPVSSRALGESVWHAHLTWGATKAAAFLAQEGGSATRSGGDGGHDAAEDDHDPGHLES